jgi:hypothetical protein
MPTVLINPQTRLAETFDDLGIAQERLKNGYHLPLINEQGSPVSAPFDVAQQLVSMGRAQQPTPEQLGGLVDYGKYTTLPQKAITAGEGAASALTFGLSGALGGQDALKRAQYNPGSHTLGEIGGLIASTVISPGTGVPGIMARAGRAAEVGVEELAGKSLLQGAAKVLARGAAEGAVFQAGHEVNEALLGDPNITAESALSHIGLAGALGGVGALAFQPISVLTNKILGSGKSVLGATTTTRAAETGTEVSGKIEDWVSTSGLPKEEQQGLINGLSKLKSNVEEIKAAGKRAGIEELPEGMVSDNKMVQNVDSSLSQKPTIWGEKRRLEYQKVFNAVNKNIDEALGPDIGASKGQIGDQLQQGISRQVELVNEPISNAYKALEEAGLQVEVNPNLISQAQHDILNGEHLVTSRGTPLSESSPGYKLARRVSEDIEHLTTADDIRRYTQQLGQDFRDPVTGRLPYNVRQITDALDNVRMKSAANAVNSGALDSIPEIKQAVSSYVDQYSQVKASYGDLIDSIKQVGKATGIRIGRGEGPETFLAKLEQMSPEEFANRLLKRGNIKTWQMFQDKFPQEAELLASLKKQQIREYATRTGELRPDVAIKRATDPTQIDPTIRGMVFNKEQLQKLEDAKLLQQNLPKKVGPSGTPEGQQYMDWLLHPIKTATSNASDLAKYSFIKSAVKLNPSSAPSMAALHQINSYVYKTADAINKNAGAIFARIGMDEKKEKKKSLPPAPVKLNPLATEVLNHSTDPGVLTEHLNNSLMPVQRYAPDFATAYTASIANAVNFLASKVPNQGKNSPMDSERVPSQTEIYKFNRYADLVNNPINLLTHVKNGTLLPQDLEAVSITRPLMFEQMKQATFNKMVESTSKKQVIIPYKTRLSLGMFLGINLDSTMTPAAIMSNQQVLASGNVQRAQNQQQFSKNNMGKMHMVEADQTKAQSSAMRKG